MIMNYFFLAYFLFECIFKMIGLGFTGYFKVYSALLQ